MIVVIIGFLVAVAKISNTKYPTIAKTYVSAIQPTNYSPIYSLYTSPWYLKDYYFYLSDNNFNKCPICMFNSAKTSNNSKITDIVLTSSFQDVTGLFPFIKSFRTTGTKAQMMIFMDEINYVKYMNKYPEFFDACHVHLINVGDIDSDASSSDLSILSYFIYYDFLASRAEYINRVILASHKHTIFQGDPFTEEFEPKYLYLVEDCNAISSYESLVRDIKECQSMFFENHKDKNVLNTNFICGGFHPIQKFLNFMIQHSDVEQMKSICPINGQIHVFYYTDVMQFSGIKTRLVKQGYPFLSLTSDSDKFGTNIGRYHLISQSNYPSVLLNYDQDDIIERLIYLMCPHGFIEEKEYVTGIREEYLENLEDQLKRQYYPKL